MHRLLHATAVSLLLLFAADPVSAQAPRPERPYRGLFGGGIGETSQLLTASASLGGGWDSNIADDARETFALSDLNTTHRGPVGQLSGALMYSLNLSRISFGAVGSSTARYYPSLSGAVPLRHNASAFTAMQLAKGLSANAFTVYSPYSVLSLFPALAESSNVAAPDFELASSTAHYLAYGAGLTFSRQLSRRTTFAADYSYQTRPLSSFANTFSSQSTAAGLTYQLTSWLGLKVGFRYSNARDSAGNESRSYGLIDAGGNYNKRLSFSRRTSLSFSTGASTSAGAEEEIGNQTQVRLRATGTASLSHEIGRTWSATLSYSRGFHLSEHWFEPVFSEGVSATVGGLLSRRVTFQSKVRASNGRVDDDDDRGFGAVYGTSVIGFALNRYVGLGVTYAYYHHRFSQSVALAPGFPHDADRHSIRAYVNMWTPLFYRSRRADATR